MNITHMETNTENLQRAFDRGFNARGLGIDLICQDQKFLDEFCNCKAGESLPFMKQWRKGWTQMDDLETQDL